MKQDNVIDFLKGAVRLQKLERFKEHHAHINEVIAYYNVKASLERREKLKTRTV